MKNLCFILAFMLTYKAYSQQSYNWKKADTAIYNKNDTAKIWRSGGVAISNWIRNPYEYKLLVTNKYEQKSSRAAYFGINEPDWLTGDSTNIGLATDSLATYAGIISNHFANFKSGTYFQDVHNSSFESNFFRGTSDTLGFRDGGRLRNGYVARFAGAFGNNGRPYITDEFDILNLRLFTGNTPNNTAEITNFYGIRFDYIRGINPQIIKNGWGIYIVPSNLKNHFGGSIGIGTTNVTNTLTVQADTDPIKVLGIQNTDKDHQLITIDNNGILHKKSAAALQFEITTTHTTLSDTIQLYIHKGGDVIYTIPAANTRIGKSWKIVNIGSGIIRLSTPYYEGNSLRNDILNVAGGYTREIFSDGTHYIAIQ